MYSPACRDAEEERYQLGSYINLDTRLVIQPDSVNLLPETIAVVQ